MDTGGGMRSAKSAPAERATRGEAGAGSPLTCHRLRHIRGHSSKGTEGRYCHSARQSQVDKGHVSFAAPSGIA